MNTKPRNSSFELLRIIIMFMILLLHSNFATLGAPNNKFSLSGIGQDLAQALTIVAVNIFVLITGYFGTSFKIGKVLQLLYQCFFCVVPISLIILIFGYAPSDIEISFKHFNFFSYWFIVAYIAMLAFTPLLNIAVERMSSRQLLSSIIILYAILGLGDYFHFFSDVKSNGGYSPIWFLVLYLIGRYLRNNPVAISNKKLFLIYVVSALGCALISMPIPILGSSYNNPFVLISSISLFLIFTKFNFYNKWINKIGAASTMVYLLNTHPIIWIYFQRHILFLNDSYNNVFVFVLFLLLYCFVFFIIAIIYDQFRQLSWKMFAPMISHLSNKFQHLSGW